MPDDRNPNPSEALVDEIEQRLRPVCAHCTAVELRALVLDIARIQQKYVFRVAAEMTFGAAPPDGIEPSPAG